MAFYVTTPIYYVNAAPHLGHAYTTIGADILARHMRQRGEEVFFLTGTDEHGEPVAQAAEREGVSPKELADRNAQRFKDLMPRINVSNDFFIRTSDPRHDARVQEVMQRIYDNGHVYKGLYEGWYCPRCADFKTDAEIGPDNTCPIHRIPLDWRERGELVLPPLDLPGAARAALRRPADFVLPRVRFNEARSFIAGGLQDVSLSRAKLNWGVPVPWDPEHVFYVWFDALLNYYTALSFARDGEDLTDTFWPADFHFIGKDILKFHAVFWPAMLLAADLPLPEHLFIHGFLLMKDASGEEHKMSKSLGNVLDPFEVMDQFGTDALRYYCFREVSFGLDGSVSTATFGERYASELANEYGNLASRTLEMIARYCDGAVPDRRRRPGARARLRGPRRGGRELLDRAEITQALDRIWQRVRRLNRYVEESAPWKLAKDPEQADVLDTTLRSLAEGLRVLTVLLHALHARVDRASCSRALGDERRPRRSAARARRAPVGAPGGGAAIGRARPPAASRSRPHVIDSHTHLDHGPGARGRAGGRRARGGRQPHPHDRDGLRGLPLRARRRRALRGGLRRRRPPPQQRRGLRRRGRRRAAPSSRSTRAAWRSGRRASTTTATARRARTRRARSPPRSSSPARPASRSSSTPARPRTRRSTRSPRARRASRSSCTASRCPTASTSASSAAGGSPSPATSPTRSRAELAAAAERVPLDRLLVETDAPYLTPQARAQAPQPDRLRGPHRALHRRAPRHRVRRARAGGRGERRAPVRLVSELPAQPSLRRLKAFGIRPVRDLGQNFLIDSNLLGVIERAAELGPDDVVLEVGGGLGVLSEYLADRAAHVHVVEVDRRLEPALRDATDPHANVTLHFADAVKLDLAALDPAPTKVDREPALRRRRDGDPAHDRAAAVGRHLGRDGPARGRRALRRAPGQRRLRRAVGARPARLRGARAAPRLAPRLPPGAERRLGARRPAPPRPGARARAARARAAGLRAPAQGARRARSRWPPNPAPERPRPRPRRARGDSATPPPRAPRSSRPRSGGRCTRRCAA